MTTSIESQPPKFQQGPRDFCMPPELTLEIPSPGNQDPKPELRYENFLIRIGIMITGAIVAVYFLGSGPFVVLGLLMAVGGAISTILEYRKQRANFYESKELRTERFEVILAKREQQAKTNLEKTQACLLRNDPDFEGCQILVQSRDRRRLWSRIANDHDFLRVRLGLGAIPFQVKFKLASQMDPLVKDPYEEDAEKLAKRYRYVPDVPVLLDLQKAGVAGIAGEREAAIVTARTIALQLATHHSPDVLRLAAVIADDEVEQWRWMRWLPQVWREDRQFRYMADDGRTAQVMLDDLAGILRQRDNQLQTRHSSGAGQSWPVYYVVFVAEPMMLGGETRRLLTEQGPQLGFHAIFLAGREAELPRECGTVVTAGPDSTLRTHTAGHESLVRYTADAVNENSADEFSRLLAPLRFESATGAIPNLIGLFDLLELNRVEEWDVLEQWRKNDSVKSLQVPIGIGSGGRKVMFDIHDGEGGHGPHGLAAGTSGSGKTRFLECLVAILAAHYHPHELSFMLVDFKGSDFLHTIPDLPHCISILSSIEGKSEDEQSWHAIRALKALQAESKRRQRLFAELKVSKISKYHEKQRVDANLEPVPRLIIIVDEFAELASQQPDFLAGLVSLARIGRSLGMHLILSTQQPSGIVTDQIWANSRFRLSMKFNKTEDSQAVLKRPDAAYIEQRGRGYLQVGENEVFELFQAPFGGIPYEEIDLDQLEEDREIEIVQVALNGERILHLKKEKPKPEQTQLKALVQHVKREAARAGIEPVPDLLPEATDHIESLEDIRDGQGWNGSGWSESETWLQPAMGILDDPASLLENGSEPIPLLRPDLSRFGHLFICCDISDHTRLPMRTLVTSLALDHSPEELHFYALDFGNNALGIFKDLPHLGASIRITEVRRITRLFRWLFTELEERRELLATLGLSWAQARQEGKVPDRPAIVLLVDNLIKWKDETNRKDELGTLVNEGAQNGIHLIMGGESRAATLFGSILGGVGPRLALGFPDKKGFREIIEGMPYGQNVLGGFADQGVYYDTETGAFECRVVTPVHATSADEGEQKLRALAGEMKDAAEEAGMAKPFTIGELPPELPLERIMPGDIHKVWLDWEQEPRIRMPIGLDDLTLEPLDVDLQEEGPHFLIIGPPKGGKTVAMWTWLLSLAARVPPDQLRLILFDNLRHTLQPLYELPHVWRTVSSDEDISELFGELREIVDDRNTMGFDPPVLLVFDDLAQFDSTPLRTELAKLARQGAARGLHVLASGRTADLNKYSDLEKALLRYRSGLFVGSHTIEPDATFFDIILPLGLSKERLPRGRGYLVCQGEYHMVQVATPGDADQVFRWVELIRDADIAWENGVEDSPGDEVSPDIEERPSNKVELTE